MIAFFPVTMTHEDISDGSFSNSHPKDCLYSLFKPGDEYEWSRLQATTDSFENVNEALAHFQQEFGQAIDDLKKRCFFLKTNQEQIIGSAIAWYGNAKFDQDYGRLHWVVIHPDFRGKGYGKQLINYAMYQLSMSYSKAFLTTQTTSYPAINIYLDLGFRPWLNSDRDKLAWGLIQDLLKHPALQ